MNFIRSVVSTLNYPNRLRAEGGYTGEFNWNSGLNIGQMEINLHNAQQNPMPYSLSQQAASLLTSIEVLENNQNIPVAPILFISDTSDFALKNADRWFAKLSGISITFILLGTNVDQSKLENCLGDISWTFIYWTDLTLFAPDGWDYNSFNAFGCVHPPTPTGSITPYTIPSPTPTESPDCQSWISFSVDSTYTIVFNDFYTELTFLSKIIGVDFHYPQKIQVTTNSGEYVRWYNHDSMVEIKGTVLTLPQYSHLRYNLSSQFEYLASELENIDSLPNVATIIFISDTSDSALLGAEGFLPYLTN
uniref:VWFA domain-containing protein n=1 Tax=Panagrolaimus sp. ES5 TaxID=591445 RepID=A0AC34GDP9_9BILA